MGPCASGTWWWQAWRKARRVLRVAAEGHLLGTQFPRPSHSPDTHQKVHPEKPFKTQLTLQLKVLWNSYARCPSAKREMMAARPEHTEVEHAVLPTCCQMCCTKAYILAGTGKAPLLKLLYAPG
eukprot:283310-Chlamydomonas_euryale.AAC.4